MLRWYLLLAGERLSLPSRGRERLQRLASQGIIRPILPWSRTGLLLRFAASLSRGCKFGDKHCLLWPYRLISRLFVNFSFVLGCSILYSLSVYQNPQKQTSEKD